jgi:hypothetical protein
MTWYNDEAAVEEKLEVEAARAELPTEWIMAYLHPECFYCGVELELNDVTKVELPQERICQRCHDKISDEEDY